MTEQEIIEYWKQGYTVDQIVNKNPIVKNTKRDENVVRLIQSKVEKVILKYQS